MERLEARNLAQMRSRDGGDGPHVVDHEIAPQGRLERGLTSRIQRTGGLRALVGAHLSHEVVELLPSGCVDGAELRPARFEKLLDAP